VFEHKQRTEFQPVEDRYYCSVAIYRSRAWFVGSDGHLTWWDNPCLVSVEWISAKISLLRALVLPLTCTGVVFPCMKFCMLAKAVVEVPLVVVVVCDMFGSIYLRYCTRTQV